MTDQLNMGVFFWYLGKSNLSSVHVNSSVNWNRHFIKGTRKNTAMLTGHPVPDDGLWVPGNGLLEDVQSPLGTHLPRQQGQGVQGVV